MMSKRDNKRKRGGPNDGPPSAAAEEEVATARNPFMAEARAMLEQSRSQTAQMQKRMDAVERRSGELERRCDAQEERCRFLEARCDSLERSVQILARDQTNYRYTAPFIPTSHWTGRGFGNGYARSMDRLVRCMEKYSHSMRKGDEGSASVVRLGPVSDPAELLLHDDALLPYWREVADALQLCDFHGRLVLKKIQLPSTVREILAPALAGKRISEFQLNENGFVASSEGIQFAVEFMRSNQNLMTFRWRNNPIDGMDGLNDLLRAIISHPTLDRIFLENCLGSNVNGYDILRPLLTSKKTFSWIDLVSLNICEMGRSHLYAYLATNPPLEILSLLDNHLTDNDANLIANALKQNSNLKRLDISGHNITEVGSDALNNVFFDDTCFNSMAGCNHSCSVWNVDTHPYFNEGDQDAQWNRRGKLYCLLTEKHSDGTLVNDLDLEFGTDAVKFVPKVLEAVYVYSQPVVEEFPRANALSVIYEILQGWKMPELYENHAQGRRHNSA